MPDRPRTFAQQHRLMMERELFRTRVALLIYQVLALFLIALGVVASLAGWCS